jgi:hypothetical protein
MAHQPRSKILNSIVASFLLLSPFSVESDKKREREKSGRLKQVDLKERERSVGEHS